MFTCNGHVYAAIVDSATSCPQSCLVDVANCCSNNFTPLPCILYATFSTTGDPLNPPGPPTGCPCGYGTYFPLYYDSSTNRWTGSNLVDTFCTPHTITLSFYCQAGDFKLDAVGCTVPPGCTLPQTPIITTAASVVCSPSLSVFFRPAAGAFDCCCSTPANPVTGNDLQIEITP